MHPARAFAWDDLDGLLAFAQSIAFTRIFATVPAGPRVAHVPVLLTGDGRLRFHLSNGNALAQAIDGMTVLALCEGPNAYLSANWYHDVRGAVPSWNYVAAEFEGPVQRLDRAALICLVDDLAARLEPRVAENWTRSKMDPARFDALLNAITAFELTPVAWRGTRKLSQNKPDDEAERLIAGMDKSGARAMAAAMRDARQ